MPAKYTPEQRISAFWSKVDKSGGDDACWIWTGSRHGQGYGHLGWNGHMRYSHRISWELTNGPIPDGLKICHNCPDGDNPACCNPAHLFLGTLSDNSIDRERKGRGAHPKGEDNWCSKLTFAKADEIRRMHRNREASQSELAAKFGVSQSLISNVLLGKGWKE